MTAPRPSMSQEIAEAVIAFQEKTTGHPPKAITVVLSQDALVITLHEALSPVERDLAKKPSGAAKVQEFHRQLFSAAAEWLLKDIRRITGVEWRDAVAEVEPATGAMVQAFTRGPAVQVFCLSHREPESDRGKHGPGN